MAQPGQSSQSAWVSLMPFVLMIGIFYVLVLMPMRKRQKKISDFQSSLKNGDRVILTSGIYGVVTRLDEKTVQIQIADKVRIDVSRAAVGGFQGQPPVVEPTRSGGRRRSCRPRPWRRRHGRHGLLSPALRVRIKRAGGNSGPLFFTARIAGGHSSSMSFPAERRRREGKGIHLVKAVSRSSRDGSPSLASLRDARRG